MFRDCIQSRSHGRRGSVTIFMAFGMIMVLSMVALGVDLGYMGVVRNELQNAADAAAMAGVQKLLARELLKGSQTQTNGLAEARTQAVNFGHLNKGGGVALALDRNDGNSPDGEIVIGFIQKPSDAGSAMTFSTVPYNSVQVNIHRDQQRNGKLDLYFARVMGQDSKPMSATATATIQGWIRGFKIRSSGPTTSKLLPFALDVNVWNDQIVNGHGNDDWNYNPATNAYTPGSDGIKEVKLLPNKGIAPGNFGTIDIGTAGNSTAEVKRQILNGPNAADLSHYSDGEFKLNALGILITGGDTGISAGFESELMAIRGQPRIIPLYLSPVVGNGNNAKFTIVGFAGVVITEVNLNGSQNSKHVTIQPEFVIDNTAIGGGSSTSSYFVYKGVQLTR